MDMENHLQDLADSVRNDTAEMCATIAEIYRLRHAESDFQHGYNAAATDIAAKIRETKKEKR